MIWITQDFTFSSETSKDFKLLPTTRSSSSSSTILLWKKRNKNSLLKIVNYSLEIRSGKKMCHQAPSINSLMDFPTFQLIFFIDMYDSLRGTQRVEQLEISIPCEMFIC